MTGWTKQCDIGFNANTESLSLFYKLAAGTETTITATASLATNMELQIYEYTGSANPIIVDGSNTSKDADGSPTTTLVTGSITTTNANDLIFTGGYDPGGGTRSWTTATTLLSFGLNSTGGQNIVSTTQTGYTDTYHGNSGVLATVIAAFQASASIPTNELLAYNHIGIGLL
jgi:hypothetical protein